MSDMIRAKNSFRKCPKHIQLRKLSSHSQKFSSSAHCVRLRSTLSTVWKSFTATNRSAPPSLEGFRHVKTTEKAVLGEVVGEDITPGIDVAILFPTAPPACPIERPYYGVDTELAVSRVSVTRVEMVAAVI